MENTYCKPKASNFPCVDALLLSDQEVLYMFQMTIAGKHPIKLGPLCRMLTALRAKNKFERVCLVFVLPSELEGKARWRGAQVFTNDKTASEMEKQQMENVTQHAMFLSKKDVAWLKGAEISIQLVDKARSQSEEQLEGGDEATPQRMRDWNL
ncbi:hypothetical protein GUITHDRAFT_123007 [Guillardia theta CCMP2712]|uniref:Uncharacterized protein n=3 Tax=Guillardia theta (strain CCMP2712) TaxID=905079 RepID=L1I3J1_GUITC|nr:hypothetical protein GUITHDRAFT_123007 [Guillardia theta CCMP2712]EKX30778.1 hypothetical protein GUITHDRAFT_123007 [Guillardia theta CCMP2712]|eukprot:XP_005817758.1 hypothetical protein GUITHDRAFT_123007 [Guillardia theta CCMP2712]